MEGQGRAWKDMEGSRLQSRTVLKLTERAWLLERNKPIPLPVAIFGRAALGQHAAHRSARLRIGAPAEQRPIEVRALLSGGCEAST